MEDPTTADQLLRDIHFESLQQLLASVQQKVNPPGATGIPSFDSYLSALAGQLGNSSLLPSYLKSGDVIQIEGGPGSGKTHILYYLVASCIMPRYYLSEAIGGWAKAAFIIDTGGHFRVSRLRDILLDRLQGFLPSAPAGSAMAVAGQCLDRVHVFRPTSSAQLIATLAQLAQYQTKTLPKTELGILAIHSIDSFYWLDRFRAEQLHSTAFLGAISRNIFAILEALRSCYGFITILIRWEAVQQFQNKVRMLWGLRANSLSSESSGAASQQSSPLLSPRILLMPLTLDGRSSSAAMQWTARVEGYSEFCIFNCEIRDKGVTLE